MNFNYAYVKITKICKFERKFDHFTPYLSKGRGSNSSNEMISLVPVIARHTHTHTHTHTKPFTMLLRQRK